MRRRTNYKYAYSACPSNCPMCGSRTVSDLDEEQLGRLGSSRAGEGEQPAWYCKTCEAIFYREGSGGDDLASSGSSCSQ